MNQTSNFIQLHARNRRGASQTVAQMQAVDQVDSLVETPAALGVPSREDIAIENESAVATRRLDEAVLRLDRAVSIRKQREAPTSKRVTEPPTAAELPSQGPVEIDPPAVVSPEPASNPSASRSPQAAPTRNSASPQPGPLQRDVPRVSRSDQESGMHLDASVSGSTSIWMESEDQSTRLRIDRPMQAPGEQKFNRIDEPLIVSGVTRVPLRQSDVTWSDEPVAATTAPVHEATIEPETQPIDSTLVAEEAAQAVEIAPPIQSVSTLETVTKNGPGTAIEPDETIPSVQPTVAIKRPFISAWQIDELDIPDTVTELFLAGEIAEDLGQRIADAQLDGLGSIAITSVQPGEGRSTVAMGIALSVAYSGMKVALVDADADGPTLADDFGLELDQDWVDAIRDGVPIEEVAVASETDALTLIPLLAVSNQAAPTAKELEQVIERLKQSFDLVIVDCGNADLSVATLCDTALIVRDVPRTRASEIESLVVSLRRNGISGVGIVENFCTETDAA